jgi:K+-transporting ATPase KdpF subunit
MFCRNFVSNKHYKMKTKIPIALISLLVVPVNSDKAVSNSSVSYLIGGIIALLILGYLIYTLLQPDKF